MPWYFITKKSAQHLIEACGILCQEQAQCASFNLNTLSTSECWLKLFNAGHYRIPVDAQCLGGCNCCQRIIDIVKSGQGNHDFSLLCSRFNLHAEPINTISDYLHCSHICFRAYALAL